MKNKAQTRLARPQKNIGEGKLGDEDINISNVFVNLECQNFGQDYGSLIKIFNSFLNLFVSTY
jgi:hypothetical protein